MVETVRAFVAAELQRDVMDELGRVVSTLAGAGVRGLRVVRPEGAHLTLKFLGSVPEGEVGAVGRAVSAAAGRWGPLKLTVGGFGAYPGEHSPRVLWVGVSGPEALFGLRADIEESLVSFGVQRDRRAWSPHITLARIRDGVGRLDRRRCWETLARLEPVFRRTMVSDVSLISSELAPGGAVYRTLGTFAMGRTASESAI